ncbi:hypothetical protein [Variovorax paradoxus]|uniref:hypothetical protein n=1 Tax=Variovorax paradoxus TaxID=34073 RepID=UPI0019349C01|nr:hypothetical protein INQ48_18065 [Variovorax paradoxus]
MQAPQTMVYKAPGAHELHGVRVDYLVVDDTDLEAKLAHGWHLTPAAAQAALDARVAVPAASTDDTAPPTRAELEAKAAELGLTYDKRLGDKRLQALIEEKIAAAAASPGE